jgi:hypothetical protein
MREFRIGQSGAFRRKLALVSRHGWIPAERPPPRFVGLEDVGNRIGPGWIDATDPRLDNPSDFVRIEIGEGLARDISVAPVLIGGTPMPDVDLLPDNLKELMDRLAEFVEYRTFDGGRRKLIVGVSRAKLSIR